MTEAPPDRPTMEHLIKFYESLAEGIDVILNGKEVTTDKSKRKNGFVLLDVPLRRRQRRLQLHLERGEPRADHPDDEDLGR